MNRIKEVREEKQVSQAELARISGISRQTISKIEADPETNVTVETLAKIAEALGVRFEDIFLSS